MAKGLSPLTSTLILLVVSIALGATVMTWGEEYIEQRAEFAQSPPDCSTARIESVTIQGNNAICYRADEIHAILDNTDSIPLDGIHATIISNDVTSTQVDLALLPAETGKAKIPYDVIAHGIPLQVRLAPIINGQTCTTATITIEPIPFCE